MEVIAGTPVVQATVKPKKTRVRRPKERPPFYINERSKGRVDTFFIPRLQRPVNIRSQERELKTCPYVKYVPIFYLSHTPRDYRTATIFDLRSVVSNNNRNISLQNQPQMSNLSPLMIDILLTSIAEIRLGGIGDGKLNRQNLAYCKHLVKEFLQLDASGSIFHQRWNNKVDVSVNALVGTQFMHTSMRSYSSVNGFYSSFLGSVGAYNSYSKPQILATCAPGTYLEHKINMLLNRPLDMSKVVIFVNRELDLPGASEGIPNAYKALYTKFFEDILNKSGALVVKVPVTFIEEMCFVSSFKVESTNRNERKEEINTFLKKFYEVNGIDIQFESMLREAGINATVATESPIVTNFTVTVTPDPLDQWLNEGQESDYEEGEEPVDWDDDDDDYSEDDGEGEDEPERQDEGGLTGQDPWMNQLQEITPEPTEPLNEEEAATLAEAADWVSHLGDY